MKDLATLTQELSEMGIRVLYYSLGVGCKDGVDYRFCDIKKGGSVAGWFWYNGLQFNKEVSKEIRDTIHLHCMLYVAS